MTWQPIETAPLDRTAVWLSDGFFLRVGFWAPGKEYEHHGSLGGGWRDLVKSECGGLADLHFTPTHWMHLPKPPNG